MSNGTCLKDHEYHTEDNYTVVNVQQNLRKMDLILV